MSKPKQDPKNYRKHSERNKDLINKSLKELGAGRSVLIDSEDYLIAGNGVMEQAEALGIPTRVIETDGSELVVVKRTDLKLGDAKRKELALADNATSDASEWDVEALESDWDALELGAWGVELNEWEDVDYSDKNKEIDIDGLDSDMVIKLKYVEDEYDRVKEALSKIAQTPEAAVWKLLGFE